jgi:integrase
MIRSLPWNELESIDWDSDEPCPEALWRVPASRMKLILELKSDEAFDHLVPLSQQAVDVLRAMRGLTGSCPLVFPSSRHSHVPMSENTVNYFYNRCGYQGRHVPHGWRASFSTIMNEWAERAGNAGDRHVIDLMLAHIPEGVSGSESAYNRAAYMERRRELSNAWADMLMDGLAKPETLLFGSRR